MTDYRHDIEKYLKGELTPAERNALERKALHDPFLADALEGAEQIKASDFSKDVAALNEGIAGKKSVSVWRWPARIAAGLAFIVVSTFIIWTVLQTEQPQDLALEKSEPAATPPVSSDSITPATGILSSPPVEQPSAGPTLRDKDVATRSSSPSKIKTNPQQAAAGESDTKSEHVDALVVAEAEELKAAEPAAEAKTIEKEIAVSRAKVEDDQPGSKMLAKRNDADKKKDAPAKPGSAPAGAESRDAGFTYSLPANVIRGQVTSAEDGSPLPGVNVIIKNSTIGTSTDEKGNYQITTNDSNPTLVYSFIGLQSTVVKADKEEMNVQMTLDAAQLSEIVVTGSGVQSGETLPPTVDLAHPEIGNRAFKQYLEKNIRYPEEAKTKKIEGRVTVEFTIEPNGALTNFNIIRGIGSGCDEELIRLIKEGPKWIPTKKDNVAIQGKAKVQLKFKLPR